MTLGDIAGVMAIEKTITSPWSEKQMRAELTGNNGWSFVCREHPAGTIIGFITGTLVCNEADIRKLAVGLQHRRSGVASFLLAHLFTYLNKQRVTKCFLELRSSNLAAKKLYHGFNFHDIGVRKGYYREANEDAILMSKIIKESFLKSIKELPISGAKILMRVDFNVPLDENGTITDDTRIKGVLPTIEYARKKNAAIILISHCGRPKGKKQAKFSMAPAAERLAQLLDHEVKLAPDCIGPEVDSMVEAMLPGDITLLENLRFHEGETQNDPVFAHGLSQLADIYINDAFAVSHRAHASVEGVTHYIKECGAGLLLKKEMDFFQRSVSKAESPLIAILGGAKVSSKLGAIRHMLDKVDKMIIGGAMANTFLKSQGIEIGSSLVEDDLLETAQELLNLAKNKGVAIHLPNDCVVAEQFSAEANHKTVTVQNVPANWSILDIGPDTEKLFAEALESSRTIVWNGPMGAFEMEPYAHGSLAMAQLLSKSKALTVVGGGDTNALINKANVQNDISYMSTGGGAFLMLMEGKELPGVKGLG